MLDQMFQEGLDRGILESVHSRFSMVGFATPWNTRMGRPCRGMPRQMRAEPAQAEFPDVTRGPAGLIDGKAPGNASKLDDAQRQALAAIVERGPIPAIHEVVRWRLADLAQWIWEEFGISLSETTVGRELRALGYRKISARPRHYAQNGLAIDDFKKRISSRTGGDPRRASGWNRDGAVLAG